MSRRTVRRYRKNIRGKRKYNSHTYIRSVEALYYNDGTTGAITSSDTTILPTLINMTGISTPYGNSSAWSGALSMAFNKTIQSSEITALYDYYKIKGVKITFDYASNVALANAYDVPMPRLAWHYDYDDTVFQDYAHYMQATARVHQTRLDKKVTLFVKPRIKDAIQQTTGGTVSTPAVFKRAWIDCNYPEVPHFGLKFALIDWPYATDGAVAKPLLRVRFDYYIAAKGVQ